MSNELYVVYYLLFAIAAFAFTLAVFNGTTYGWKRWRTIVNFLVGVLAFGAGLYAYFIL